MLFSLLCQAYLRTPEQKGWRGSSYSVRRNDKKDMTRPAQIPALPLTCSVTLDKLLNLSELKLHQQKWAWQSYPGGKFWRLTKMWVFLTKGWLLFVCFSVYKGKHARGHRAEVRSHSWSMAKLACLALHVVCMLGSRMWLHRTKNNSEIRASETACVQAHGKDLCFNHFPSSKWVYINLNL